ncbi:MAG: DUF1353 domain-containing protein [Desulfobacterales bacterium]|nr:DUF1353 domain-containing protein [Desulfobacterales bacterium]
MKKHIPSIPMPKLIPQPIETKGRTLAEQLRVWIFEVRKWKLAEDWDYTLPNGEKIVIPADFEFDGASIPRPLWGILSPIGLLLIPGLIHDFGYRYDYIWTYDAKGKVYKGHENAGREYWDQLFYDVGMAVNDMEEVNFLAWLALSFAGELAWRKNRALDEDELIPG